MNYIFIVLDRGNNKQVKTVTDNVIIAMKKIQWCYSPILEIWQDSKYIDGEGHNGSPNIEKVMDMLKKYSHQK